VNGHSDVGAETDTCQRQIHELPEHMKGRAKMYTVFTDCSTHCVA
jgi:hypothetical protein